MLRLDVFKSYDPKQKRVIDLATEACYQCQKNMNNKHEDFK